MSDTYNQQNAPGYRAAATDRDNSSRAYIEPRLPTTSGGSGLATGLMVCSVFVVIAIFAAVFYNPNYIDPAAINQPAGNAVQSDSKAMPAAPEAAPEIAPSSAADTVIEPTTDGAPAQPDVVDPQSTAPEAGAPATQPDAPVQP